MALVMVSDLAMFSNVLTSYLARLSVYMASYSYIHHIRPQSNMLKNLPKMLLGISQKFPLLCLDFFLLCSIMLTVIIAVRYVYTHNLYN